MKKLSVILDRPVSLSYSCIFHLVLDGWNRLRTAEGGSDTPQLSLELKAGSPRSNRWANWYKQETEQFTEFM